MVETKILSGRELSKKILENSRKKIKEFEKKGLRNPSLAVILVGDDPASEIYVARKHEACKEVGINSLDIRLPANTSFEEIREKIKMLNEDENVDGILLQLPLPRSLREKTLELIRIINPEKDVDGFTPFNFGSMAIGIEGAIMPCTVKGILELLRYYDINVEGKDCVVIGASNIAGKPLANVLINLFATVTVCHIKTRCLSKHTKHADIVISATGVPHLIKREMVKEGAVVIDVGITRVNGKVVGDVDFESMIGHASAITPVPGGVGPLTIAMLIENTIDCYTRRNVTGK